MNMNSAVLSLVFFSVFAHGQYSPTGGGSSQQICSSLEPKSDKTCLAIRFPWLTYDVYFCTGDEFNYKKCNPAPDNYCYFGDNTTTQMQVKGPWNCCPQITQTDPCQGYPCYQLPPYNRTFNTWSYEGSCCDTYFTGPGDSYSTCNYSACPPAPENMTGVQYIYDNYGCCTYYQLQGDTKPGYCPQPYDIYYYGDGDGSGPYPGPYPSAADAFRYCIGDYTCPDAQKCCPSYSYGSTYQCRDPVTAAPSTPGPECVKST